MTKTLASVFALIMITLGCTNEVPKEKETPSRQVLVENQARSFFATFAERKDWAKLCSYYRDDMQFEDVMLQLKLDSLWQFKRFYKWDEDEGNFQKLTPDQDHLTLYSVVADDSIAVARGRVNPFYYYDERVEPVWGMEFTIWLFFDEDLQIRKQIDWMEYAPEVFENVIARVRKQGPDRIPDWLDLSPIEN